MAVYAIADLHLSFGTDKPMDVFSGWNDHAQRLEKNWRALVNEGDTVVIPGDISWGMSLEQAAADFAFVHSLPGRKILLKGNHDYWWTTRKKMDAFIQQNGWNSLHILHNDAYEAEGIAVCGTRGWFYDAEADADQKVLMREVGRLRTSIQAAKTLKGDPVVFLHYPPLYADAVCGEIWEELLRQGIRRCYYGHIHGYGIRSAFNGEKEGIRLRLISADALSFAPLRLSE